MINAFYNSKSGAIGSQKHIEVISNNISNMNTNGFKKGSADFSELLNTEIRGTEYGNGSRLGSVKTVHSQGTTVETGIETDFTVSGDGFFAVQFGEDRLYTRDGSFDTTPIGDDIFLTYQEGFVLDSNGNSITLEDLRNNDVEIGVYKFETNETLTNAGNNLFRAENSQLQEEQGEYLQGFLEGSNVDLSSEMSNLIHIQRLFQLNTRIIQTSDEIQQTINSLKN